MSDWRTWALAVVAVVGLGLTVGALGGPTSAVGSGAGALIGLHVGLRMHRLRTCTGCGNLATP